MDEKLPLPKINLLSERKRELKRQQLLFAKVQMFSVALLIVYVIALVSVVGFKAFLGNRLKNTEKGIQEEQLKIAQLQPVETKFLHLKNKLGLIGDFMANRSAFRETIVLVKERAPDTAKLRGIEFTEEKSIVTLVVELPDLASVVDYLNLIETLVYDEAKFEKVMMKALDRQETGRYIVTSEYYLKDL